MNKLSTPKRAAILRSLIEGNSVRSTCRMTGAAKGTVLRLLAEVGTACEAFQDGALRKLPCRELQLDEIWSFVGKHQRHVAPEDRGQGQQGDAWVWTAIDAHTKLIPCWHLGNRDAAAARTFIEDLASRLTSRVQITTDALRAYVTAIDGVFGVDVDYARLVKVYGAPPETIRRYSPAEFVSAYTDVVTGNPDLTKVSTSYVESHNLTMRMRNRRLTRLTNGYSKKWENHMHALSLYFMAYNFVHVHHTLTKERKGIHTTPAMAAGVTDHVWKAEEIIALLDSET